MKKRLLIIYSKNTNEILNRRSALGSYIYSLSSLLSSEFEIFINGISIDNINYNSEDVKTPILKETVISKIKRKISSKFKHLVQDVLLFSNINKLKKLIISKKYDQILEFYSYASDVGYYISHEQNIPLHIIYDGPLIEEYEFFNGHKPFFINSILGRQYKSMKQAQSIVVYSNSMRDYVMNEYGINDKFLIHQNVDFSRFEFLENIKSEEVVNICFIGSFLKWHRVDNLIIAFTKIKENNSKIRLYLIGAGQELEEIIKSVDNNVYKNDIIITGYKDGKELRLLKEKMHIGVMPSSNWYGAPNKIFEYGASNMAVVAPSTPTITDTFSNEYICYFNNNSVDGLFEELNKLVVDKSIMKSKSVKLYNFIRGNYSSVITQEFYKKTLK